MQALHVFDNYLSTQVGRSRTQNYVYMRYIYMYSIKMGIVLISK
jgi:hypothetical protein